MRRPRRNCCRDALSDCGIRAACCSVLKFDHHCARGRAVGGRFLKAVFLAAGVVVAAVTAADASVVINIDKAKQKMTVRIDGTLKYTWPVSTGKAGYATPSGSFTIF